MRHPSELHAGEVAWPKVKVLVFSLDDAFRFLVRSTFRKLSVRDVLSTSVPDDADHLVGYGPDVALVDFDGDPAAALGFIARLRGAPVKHRPDMPILVAVKAADRDSVVPALEIGIAGVVPKPVSGHELSLRVADTISQPGRAAASPPPPSPRAAAPRPAAKAAAPPEALPRPALPAIALPRPTAAPSPSPGPVPGGLPSKSASGGGIEIAGQTAPKPPGRPLAAEDLAPRPAARSGGRLSGDDVAPSAAAQPPAAKAGAVEAPAQPARRKTRSQQDWHAALAEAGHTARTGGDVAALDVGAIVATHLQWLQSQGAQGSRANFHGMDLAGADISRAVLANATFRGVDLCDASLVDSRLDGADFRHAKLGAADLSGANLGVAQLRHADLRLANLEGAVLRGADLSGARLRGARLAGADFKGAILISTDLCEADLSRAENLTQAQLDRTVCDMKTRLPPGLMRPRQES